MTIVVPNYSSKSAICRNITRPALSREFWRHCAAEIARLTGACELVELGSGSSRKTRLLLEAYSQLNSTLQYCPIDVSAGMLKTTALELLQQYPKLKLCGLAGTYEQASGPTAGRRTGKPNADLFGQHAGQSGCDRVRSVSWTEFSRP